MGIHIPARAMGVILNIRICIQLGEKFLDRRRTQGKTQGLVPVITSIKITRSEKFCNGDLGHFLAVPENAEFSLACQYFLAAEQTGFPAFTNQPVVLQYLLAEQVKREVFQCNLIAGCEIFHISSFLWVDGLAKGNCNGLKFIGKGDVYYVILGSFLYNL